MPSWFAQLTHIAGWNSSTFPLCPGAAVGGRPHQALALFPSVWRASQPGSWAWALILTLPATSVNSISSGEVSKLQYSFISTAWPTGRGSNRVTGEEKLLKPHRV